MKKIFIIITTIVLIFSTNLLQAQHLFSVSQNVLSNENIIQLKSQTSNFKSYPLTSQTIPLTSVRDTKIIILNEENGKHVVITPEKESLTEFQLTPFFMEEMKQGVLGAADRYLIVETSQAMALRSVASVAVSDETVYIPHYYYGNKANVQEALPQDRQIIDIYKQKPQLIPADPDDSELQRYVAQKEEEMSYYVYIYQLPDGTRSTYDEHFNKPNNKNRTNVGNFLTFDLIGELTPVQRLAAEYALELWGEQLAGTVPVDISVDIVPMEQGVLGVNFFPPCFSEADIWYPSSLWDQMVGYNASWEQDITIQMNAIYPFYFGLDAHGHGNDFVTILLHEVTHGIGFGCWCGTDGNFFYGSPGIYDCQLAKGLDGPLFKDLPDYERAALMVSNNLYAGVPGSNLLAANEGVRVKVYAPTNYSGGSTAHHWDSSVDFPTFMKYAYSGPLHTFNNRKIGILMDMGWKIPEIDSTAVWVTFNTNGGVGSVQPQPFLPDEIQRLKICVFTRTGYTFIEWNTAPDGTGISYQDRDSIVISNDMELYAIWEVNTYTLTFKPSGGTVSPTSKEVVFGQPVGELPVPEKEGSRFSGWFFGTTMVTESTIWDQARDRTVYAKWDSITINTVWVTFNNNEGTGSMLPQPLLPEETQRLKACTFSRTGYSFIEWNTAPDGTGIPYQDRVPITISNNIELYAQWRLEETVLEKQLSELILIAPNPTTGELRIESGELRIDKIEIFDIYGRKQKSRRAEEQNIIDISHLPAGIYLVKIITEKGFVIKKVVKN